MNAYDYVQKIGAGSYGEVSLIRSKFWILKKTNFQPDFFKNSILQKTQKKFVAKKVSLLGSTREREAAKLEARVEFFFDFFELRI